jgi:hypothetical protein
VSTDTDNVRVAQYGEIYVAPLGTTLPTSVTATLNAAFDSVGGISEDGFKRRPEREGSDVKDWAGDSVRDLQTAVKHDFSFVMLETSDITKELLGMEEGVGWTGEQLPPQSWVIDWHDGDSTTRFCIPKARITAEDEVDHSAKDVVKYGVTISPKKVDGKYFLPYYDDGVS